MQVLVLLNSQSHGLFHKTSYKSKILNKWNSSHENKTNKTLKN